MILTYLKIGVLVVAVAGSFWAGHKTTSNAWKADMLAAEQAHTKALLREVEKSNDAAAELEKARAARKVVYRTITKEVERIVDRPVYANQCFDDDGVRAVNSAILGEAASALKPDPRMPAPRALGRRDGGKHPAVGNGSGPAVQ